MKSTSLLAILTLLALAGCGSHDNTDAGPSAAAATSTTRIAASDQSGGSTLALDDGLSEPPVCSDPAHCQCGNNSILICHIPPGNPAALHSICVGLPGAINGHGITFDGKPGGHGGDYPGACRQATSPAS